MEITVKDLLNGYVASEKKDVRDSMIILIKKRMMPCEVRSSNSWGEPRKILVISDEVARDLDWAFNGGLDNYLDFCDIIGIPHPDKSLSRAEILRQIIEEI